MGRVARPIPLPAGTDAFGDDSGVVTFRWSLEPPGEVALATCPVNLAERQPKAFGVFHLMFAGRWRLVDVPLIRRAAIRQSDASYRAATEMCAARCVAFNI